MMDVKSAKFIREAINSSLKLGDNFVSTEDVLRMSPIPQAVREPGYTILALQCSDLTILVWIQFDEERGLIVRRVATQDW